MWKRPAGLSFPQVWATCEGKKPLGDGSGLRYRIQDIPADMHQAVVDFMGTYFLYDESANKCVRLWEDPASVGDARALWADVLKQDVGLVAIREGSPHNQIIGCNITCVNSKGVPFDIEALKGERLKTVLRLMVRKVESLLDVYEHFETEHYLSALGLSVSPEFRGQGVGEQILRARFPLLRALGLRVTVTVFSGSAAQTQASRAGFHTLVEMPYQDYRDDDGRVIFHDMEAPSLKIMAKLSVP